MSPLVTRNVAADHQAHVYALLNVTEDSPGAVPVGTMSGRKVFSHVFKSLSFGDITVTNPRIVEIPDIVGINDPDDSLRTGAHIKKVDDDLEPDIAIGMDIVKKLHISVATRESRLYITATNTPPG